LALPRTDRETVIDTSTTSHTVDSSVQRGKQKQQLFHLIGVIDEFDLFRWWNAPFHDPAKGR
jgi:hypothetical protein